MYTGMRLYRGVPCGEADVHNAGKHFEYKDLHLNYAVGQLPWTEVLVVEGIENAHQAGDC